RAGYNESVRAWDLGVAPFFQDVIIPYYVRGITSAAQFSCRAALNQGIGQPLPGVSGNRADKERIDGVWQGIRKNRRRHAATGLNGHFILWIAVCNACVGGRYSPRITPAQDDS
ncbi:MAG: hypothetical protein ABN490_19765, partial [Pantoea agglomerans]